MTDLLRYAGGFAAKRQNDRAPPPVRVTHWQTHAERGEVCCTYDSHPGPTHALAVLVIPGNETNRMVIDYGDIITAGGVLAWADLGLRLVERFLGPTVMLDAARFMNIDPPGREQRYACLEPRTFLRRFVKSTGMKPSEYQQRLRLTHAREMLEFSRKSVDEIAASVGYHDVWCIRRGEPYLLESVA